MATRQRKRTSPWVNDRRLVALIAVLLAALPLSLSHHAGAQSNVSSLLGCFSPAGPQGKALFQIYVSGGQYGFTFVDSGKREGLQPARQDDLIEIANELELGRFPGTTIVGGLSDQFRTTTFVVLSSALAWQGRRTPFAMFDVDMGLDPLFKVACL